MTLIKGLTRLLTLAAVWLVASAHVGSSLTVQEGQAGPYGIRVLVRPPGVIPGLVEVVIKSTTPAAVPTTVTVRPALWRFGLKGAPPAEPTTPVPGEPGTFTTRVWIMQSGSYAFHVNASGTAGSGSLVVPVTSEATTASTLPSWLGWLLAALGVFLVLGLVSVIGAASRESSLPAGARPGAPERGRARRAMAVTACLTAAVLFGGWKWWDAVDTDYRARLAKPLDVATTITGGAQRTLTLRITDKTFFSRDTTQPDSVKINGTPLMPDHGKMLHLFLVEAGARGAVAHLHPLRQSTLAFTTPVTGVPAGTYWLFAEAVRESGYSVALTDTVTIPDGSATPNIDGDDAWTLAAPPSSGAAPATLSDGAQMRITLDGTPTVGTDVTIRARVTERDGTPAPLAPWLGMAGHAMVVRTDGQVFLHLHPMGTSSMAAQERLLRREAGDTVNHGEKQPTAPAMPHAMPMSHAMPDEPVARGDVSFPVAFPSAGTYRVFVQVRRVGRAVETAVMDVLVPQPPATR
jgi:predicted secreted protein